MKKYGKTRWIMTVLGMVLFGIATFYGEAESLSGRDIAERGTLKTLTGLLKEKDREWFLKTPEQEYELHLGNYEAIYPRGIELKEGTTAEVYGFVHGVSVAPVWVKNQNRTYKFRDKDGTPLWAGKGQGRNRDAQKGSTQKGSTQKGS